MKTNIFFQFGYQSLGGITHWKHLSVHLKYHMNLLGMLQTMGFWWATLMKLHHINQIQKRIDQRFKTKIVIWRNTVPIILTLTVGTEIITTLKYTPHIWGLHLIWSVAETHQQVLKIDQKRQEGAANENS